MLPVNPNQDQDQNINCTLSPHMVKVIALSLFKEWLELRHLQREQPLQKICFTTLTQCFNKIGLSRVVNILLKTDDNFLNHLMFTVSEQDAAKHFILYGCLPQRIDQIVEDRLKGIYE